MSNSGKEQIMDTRKQHKLIQRRWRTFTNTWFMFPLLNFLSFLFILCLVKCENNVGTDYHTSSDSPQHSSLTEFPGGLITKKQRLEKSLSPYAVREDIVIDAAGELVVDPGVEIRFSPMVGITVHGVLSAKGTSEEKIVLTTLNEPERSPPLPKVRLVDGPTILSGRLQVLHNGVWRGVCTNSRNWTLADLEVICRQLGFQGGSWGGWWDRQQGVSQPRLLLETPDCRGTETSIQDCKWSDRQLGAGVCDYHPDLGVQCLPFHVTSSNIVQHWRGLSFLYAQHDKALTQSNTLYVSMSRSQLAYVHIKFAGSGRDYNATSAIHVEGVPPRMSTVSVINSAYNGINITSPGAPVILDTCTLRNCRGYGVYINSSVGAALLNGCQVSENGGDGIKYVNHEEIYFQRQDILDFCSFATTSSQTFPITVSMQQFLYSPTKKECTKNFLTKWDQVLTVHFLQTTTDRNDSTLVKIYDGSSPSDNLLASVTFRNSTKPQSVTSTRNSLFITYTAEPKTDVVTFMRITSSYRKWYDLNVTDSTVEDNNGRGIAIENLRSQIHLQRTAVSNNNHVAGVHVLYGAGDVNITDSRIAFNVGDGVNISFTGGNTNVSSSSLSSNKGFGLAVWLNDTKYSEYKAFHQETVIAYTEIFRNLETGLLIGNFCGDSIVNITGNFFNMSLNTAVEVQSCWNQNVPTTKLQIGHNVFFNNKKTGIKIRPAVNMEGVIEYNRFSQHDFGGILLKNDPFQEFEVMPSSFLIRNNEFYENSGVFVVNIGLSTYSDIHRIMFTWNFIKDNKIKEPFDSEGEYRRLLPRSRVAAPLVISSANVIVYRNIIQNHESDYELGSHLEDQGQVINCTYNWLGYSNEEKVFDRIFHRKDRYNLAKIEYLPYLLHSSNPGASTIMQFPTFVPHFHIEGTDIVGGEVDGVENLRAGEYRVLRDINIRPGGRLALQPGVTLKFPPGVGMMVAGKLEARGRGVNDIMLTLQEERLPEIGIEAETEAPLPPENVPPVRLLGGRTLREGRLQVRLGSEWGTVCNYGWSIRDAALVCSQLGLVLNPDDWFLESADIPDAGTAEKILLSNVQCTEDDMDVTQCKSERSPHLENSCTHDQDVGLRCYEPHWAGLRLGVLAERCDLQYITIEKAGLLDYATNAFKPALQIDLSRHAMESIRVVNNVQDGLGILYSDIYSTGSANIVRNSEFVENRGSGVSFKQLGLKISGCKIENNKVAGVRHNPALSGLQQRELAGWFKPLPQYAPYVLLFIPQTYSNIEVEEGQTKYLITQRVLQDAIQRNFIIRCKPGFVLGLQLINPIHNRSTENILIYDSPTLQTSSTVWRLRTDLLVFPTTSSSFGVVLDYNSGVNALGGAVIVISSLRAPIQNIERRIVKGPVPTLTIVNTRIKGNKRGIWASFYNRYLTESGEHYLRKSNESIHVIGCDLSHNTEEVVYIDSPHWNLAESNISEISVVINSSLITDNGRGILQFSRDLRSSNNLFHWSLHDNSIERNSAGGMEVSLPYVWQYNENFTHSVRLHNNTWRNNNQFSLIIGGHFASFNLTSNVFQENICRTGLISVQGMEKRMWIYENKIENNTGIFMVEFKADSQSEIMGELRAEFFENSIKRNKPPSPQSPSSVIVFDGLQRVKVRNNLISDNSLAYALVAGVRTARLDSTLDVTKNWWGTTDPYEIINKIFDFDDWNDHAAAIFRPFLIEDSFGGSLSIPLEQSLPIDLDNLPGRLLTSMTLHPRDKPYIIRSDVTVMPGATLSIAPGVVLEFAPRVGILVLGRLLAKGRRGEEIIMRPLPGGINERPLLPISKMSLRLCTGRNNCSDSENMKEGFLEYRNATTLQWVPICDSRFGERNAQVVCRQMGFEALNAWASHGPRVEFHINSLTRIWSWPEPVQCTGEENRLEDCEIRLNGQLHGKRHTCAWNTDFVFVRCGERNLPKNQDYWGGLRFSRGEFEQNSYEQRIHDVVTHETVTSSESVIEFVNITGAGLLHNQRSPAILAVSKSPSVSNVNINHCASHGISLISPTETVSLLYNWIQHTLGVGVTLASLTGDGRESGESSFTPARHVHIPYQIFSLIDICDPAKEIVVQERVLVYYKYDNKPVTCVKIFYSAFRVKHFGFRLLQLNLLNSTDKISLYDGDIYNKAQLAADVTMESGLEKVFIKTKGPSLSIKMVASGASEMHGFIAEIVTLPISSRGFNRDVQHNISYSELSDNWFGAMHYVSAGEVNPRVTLEWNQIKDNCAKLYGNFTTCLGAVTMDLQNTQNLHFRNNLVKGNQGGLWIRADSSGTATSLKGWIHNNLFADNRNMPALSMEGRQSSPYQEVTIYRNYWAHNQAPYQNVIRLNQVVSNFTYNYLHNNLGSHILEVSGFERVRLEIYQSTSHNGFYWNYATQRDSKGTVIAGTAGQHYIDNIFFNPDNDYEIVTVNRSLPSIESESVDVWKTPIDAKHNYWGFNETLAVSGRIKDRFDESHLLEVDYLPFQMNNLSILSGKCPPGWDLVGDTCYIYVGAPMTFFEAREFCRSDQTSMPYVMGNYLDILLFLRKQQEKFHFYDRVWVQHIDKINQCTVFTYKKIEIDHCQSLNPFICEMDPKVHIDPLSWKDDIVTVAVLGSVLLAILLVAVVIFLWLTKNRHRHAERLQRRNSIRQSLHSVRSIGSSHGGFATIGAYRHKNGTSQHSSSPTMNKGSDYKKMSGSIDSMDKSQLNSSLEEDTQSYDIYEAHNPSAVEAVNPGFDLAYRNQGSRLKEKDISPGFRDNSTFASRDNSTWQSQEDFLNNSSTLPCNTSLAFTDSTMDAMKTDPDFQHEKEYSVFYERPKSSALLETNLDEPLPPPPPRAKSEVLLETDIDYSSPSKHDLSSFQPALSKSQPLETAM